MPSTASEPETPGLGPGELAALLAGTTVPSGPEFFPTLTRALAEALGMSEALVAEVAGEGRARTLAHARPAGVAELGEWELTPTPCAELAAEPAFLGVEAAARFPRDPWLARARAAAHVTVALRSTSGSVLGWLRALHPEPLAPDARRAALVVLFAARATAELERRWSERTLAEREERLRDLFDEAPIAYVHEGLDTRFLRVNRAALRAFGLRAEDVPHTFGRSFIPDTPDAQRRLREAFESVGRGADTSGVVLELRRRDGSPLWIQWWSKPAPDGTYTRTMFVDITDKVLMEQEQARLREQNRYLREEIQAVHNFDEIIGRHPALLTVLESVGQVAPTDASVLITGQTGTGKELVARAIHSSSKRKDRALIKLNCAALPTGLVESELFGHEKGAFSGAIARRIGRFELAAGGTIFLDEVGEMPLDVQVKLLRVLQEREFERVGGNTPIQADVRVIAATNRDLPQAIRAGKFREDLYYRLNVFPLRLPPLAERREDIPQLVQFFLKKFCARIGKPIDDVAPELMQRLVGYAWPGNVRELENVLERAVILARGPRLDLAAVPALAGEVVSSAPLPAPSGTLEEVERAHVRATLEAANWVIEGPKGAAQALGLHPNTLRSRLKRLGIARS